MGVIQIIREESELIKKTPWTFAITALVLAAAIFGVEYGFFKELLSSKDSLIGTLKEQLTATKNQPQNQQPSLSGQAPSSTGPATASGDGNTAVSGSNDNVGQLPTQERGKK